jgi:STE24 endopeptidase
LLLLETPAAALNVFAVPEASTAARAWSNQRDLLWVADQAAVLLLLFGLLSSGIGARLCVGLDRFTGGRRLTTAALLAGVYAFMASAVTLPISAVGQVLAASVGLAEPGWAEWLLTRGREAGALMAASSLLGLAAYWLFGRCPTSWPVWAGALAIGVTALTLAAQPLAHELRPLTDPALAEAIAKLAARAGASAPRAALRIASREGRCGGATVLGLGPTKVLTLDTGLLRHHPKREIEQVIAHELKHYVHGDDQKALYAAGLIIACGLAFLFAGAGLATRASSGRWGFDQVADPASLPLLLLLAAAFNLGATTGFRAYGRHVEKEADRFSLALTNDPAAQMALMQRLLSCSRLKNPDVSWVQKTFRQNHASPRERIEMARRYLR